MEKMNVRLAQRDFSEGLQPALELQVERLTWKALGGPAEAVLTGTAPDSGWAAHAAQWAQDLLRRPVMVVNQAGENAWWGYVHRVEVEQAGLRLVYNLDDLANRVCVLYWQQEPQLEWSGERSFTPWADDLESQKIYGVKERIFRQRSMDAAEALRARDALLVQHSQPQPRLASSRSAGQKTRVRLECRGWWETLAWKIARFDDGYEGFVKPAQLTQNMGRTANLDARIAQSFQTAYGDWICGDAVVNIRAVGIATDQVVCELCADVNGVPGTVLASATVDASLVSGSRWWVKFLFNPRVGINANTPYWLVFSRSGPLSSANYYQVYMDNSNSYPNGKLMTWNSTNWLDAAGGLADVNFYTTGYTTRLTRLEELAAPGNGGQFLTDLQVQSVIHGETLLKREGILDCREELAGLLEQGSSGASRLLAQVEADRRLVVYDQPVEDAWRYTLDGSGMLRTRSGRAAWSPDQPAGQRLMLVNGWNEHQVIIGALEWTPEGGLQVKW